jgi:hypothetical protein
MSALVGHLRHLVAVAAASSQLDLRDWMQPDDAATLLERVGQVLGATSTAGTLAERLGREVWIDFVADTGDDHDVAVAVARMLFAEYRMDGDTPRTLPRGDVLLFGGDTAYPAATADELERRLLGPWNRVLQTPGTTAAAGCSSASRVTTIGTTASTGSRGSSGGTSSKAWWNPRWARRRRGRSPPISCRIGSRAPSSGSCTSTRSANRCAWPRRRSRLLGAFLGGSKIRRAMRLALRGYTPVQEASYWVLPLVPGLDLWGVDRQLRDADFRQRVFFARRRSAVPAQKVVFVAPDPALAYGEPNELGARLLEATGFALKSDRLFYLTGDAHHYERQEVAGSLHVIAGGGGAFLHGSRIAPTAGSQPPQFVYPDKKTSRRIALGMPLQLAAGTAGFLPHLTFAALAALEVLAWRRGTGPGALATAALTAIAIFSLSLAGTRAPPAPSHDLDDRDRRGPGAGPGPARPRDDPASRRAGVRRPLARSPRRMRSWGASSWGCSCSCSR